MNAPRNTPSGKNSLGEMEYDKWLKESSTEAELGTPTIKLESHEEVRVKEENEVTIKTEDDAEDDSSDDDEEGGGSNCISSAIRSLKLAQVEMKLLKDQNKMLRDELKEVRRVNFDYKNKLKADNAKLKAEISNMIQEMNSLKQELTIGKAKNDQLEEALEKARKKGGGSWQIGTSGLQIGESIGFHFDDNGRVAKVTASGDPDHITVDKA